MTLNDVSALTTPIILLIGAGMLLLLDRVIDRKQRDVLPVTAASICLFAALPLLKEILGNNHTLFLMHHTFIVDGFARTAKVIILLATGLSALASAPLKSDIDAESPARRPRRGDFFALMLLSATGMTLVVSASDLLVLILGIEMMSLPLYPACAIAEKRAGRMESALKHVTAGILSTVFLVMGAAFFFGATGTLLLDPTHWPQAMERVANVPETPFYLAALACLLIGLLLKAGAVPFHSWLPDVYSGAPTPMTGFMATAMVSTAIIALVRVLTPAFGVGFSRIYGDIICGVSINGGWGITLWSVSGLTIIAGNVMAVVQTSVKRMLVYGSLAHIGYLLIGVIILAGDPNGNALTAGAHSMLFYLIAYATATLGAFAVLMLVKADRTELDTLSDFTGLAGRKPKHALAMAMFMFSLAGIPPFVGFFAKFLLFQAAVMAGLWPLVIIAIAGSVVSMFYYLRVILYMYMRQPNADRQIEESSWGIDAVTATCAAGVIVFGILPNILMLIVEPGKMALTAGK